MTTARWYGGQAAVPSERIFSSRKVEHPLRVQHGLRLLVEEGLVGRAAALGHEQELVLRPVTRHRVDLDLRGQVGAGVLLLPRRQRGELGVAQVEPGVGVVHALADRLGVVDAGEHALGLLAHHDRGAGVLAHREHPAGGDVDVLQQVEGDEPVVPAGLRVVDDAAQLGQVGGPEVVRDVVHGLGGELPDRLGRHLEERPAARLEGRHPLRRHQPVRRAVRADRQEVGVAELGALGGGRGGVTHARRLVGTRVAAERTGARRPLAIDVGRATLPP